MMSAKSVKSVQKTSDNVNAGEKHEGVNGVNRLATKEGKYN